MKTRIVSLLQKVDAGLPPANDLEATLLESARKALTHHETHRFLLLSPEGLRVMTFHGFCYTLIKRAPLEAGVQPGSLILDEEEQGLVLDESVRRMVHDLVSMPKGSPERKAFEDRLLRLNNRLPVLVDEIKDLIRKRDLFSDLVQAVKPHANLDDLEKTIAHRMAGLIEAFLKEAADAFSATPLYQNWGGFWHHLKEKGARNVSDLPADLPGTTWRDLYTWKTIARILTTKNGMPRQQMGPATGGFYKGFTKGPYGKLVTGLSPAVTRPLSDLQDLPESDAALMDVDALADLIILVAQGITMYERICRHRHLLDFVGLEQAALRTLAEDTPSDLQLFLDHRIQQVLVDEFQDTSRSQWTLIQRLCAGWTPGDGRTLFLVGDPKQSIYAFRKAEVRLFLEAKKGIPTSGQGLLPVKNMQLTSNFRSKAPLVAWINQMFGQTVMADPKAAFDEVPFQPSTAYPEGQNELPSTTPVFLNVFHQDSMVPSPAEAEARWLAQSVRHHSENRTGDSIGILLFARNRLPYYLDALRQIGLPVRVKEGLKIAEQPEVVHLYQIATALSRPHDDLAWAALIRSPWVWVNAARLLEVASLPPAAWSHKLKLAAEKDPDLQRVYEALRSARRRVGRDSLTEAIQVMWMALDGPQSVASRFGAEGVANCLLFLEVLESVDTGIPEETLLRLDLALETLYAPESPEAAGAPVDLMTVHAAKGLEFDAVFLPFLDWSPLAGGQHPPYLLERSPEPPHPPLMAMGPDRRLGEPDAGYPLLKRLTNGRRIGEAKRLFYVGMTRARKALFLSGLARQAKDGLTWRKNTPLDWTLRHIADHEAPTVSPAFNPQGPGKDPKKGRQLKPVPEPIPFQPQALPYRTEAPSELVADLALEQDPGARDAEIVENAAVRGIVTHRLIQTLWHEGSLPEPEKIAAAMAAEGVNPEAAEVMAQGVVEEVKACQKESFFHWLLDCSCPVGESEYALEAVKQEGTIRTGILDFVRQDDDHWWIVDFKTSRPKTGQAEAEFVEEQVAYYRPQLSAYQDMLAKTHGVDVTQVRKGLYFTSLQRWHEMT
jgi:ATP-dependent exoDNAse (exonuclease V) beta subunit